MSACRWELAHSGQLSMPLLPTRFLKLLRQVHCNTARRGEGVGNKQRV